MMKGAEWQSENGMELLHLTALEAAGPLKAFFTGRRGGVSERWAGGLNWSYSVGDEAASVRENRRRTLELIGLRPTDAVMAGLVHGNRVVALEEVTPLRNSPDEVGLVPDCDALITDQRHLALIVTAADCVPVFLYDPVHQCIGLAHAGWRGTVAGIAGRTVAAMTRQYGSRPAEIVAAVGPSIGPCCYEVGEQVAEPVRSFYGERAVQLLKPHGPDKHLLDLWEANRQDLLQAGVSRIVVAGSCTACGSDRLFSHRAEFGQAGRGAAVMALY